MTCLCHCRFRVTHIGKKPTFPEPQDGAQPDGSREPSTEELEHSSERLRRERARNGTVPTGGLENGAVQGGAKSTELSRSSTPAPNTPGSRDGRAAGRVGSSPGSTSHQRRHLSRRDLGGSSPSIPGLLGQEGGQRGSICQEEAGLGSADEVSDIHGSLSLHEGAEELGREESSRRQPAAEAMGQQVGSSSSSSPGGRLGWRGRSKLKSTLLQFKTIAPRPVTTSPRTRSSSIFLVSPFIHGKATTRSPGGSSSPHSSVSPAAGTEEPGLAAVWDLLHVLHTLLPFPSWIFPSFF